MEVLGAVSSIISIVSVARSLIGLIDGIRCHPQRRHNLQESVKVLVEKLEVAEPHFDTAFADQTRREVEELKAMFEPLGAQSFDKNCMWSCITFPVNNAKLDEAEGKLQSLTTRVILQLGLPRSSNDTAEGPISKVGIDRSNSILEFLQQTSQNEPLRIICIRGQAGVGKTTLLNHIWEKVSSKEPFLARAYVRVGEKPSEESVCSSQSRILEQLGAGRLEFSAPEFGRGDMVKHFKRLRSSNRPMIVAIDNVWDVQDLKKLLPRMATDVLPSFSCIMLTCRDEKVVKALLDICELREENPSQVFKFTPKCLSPEESLVMFAETAQMQLHAADHQALLQEVVPLCGGLPLALTVLASIFKDEARRERKEWKRIVEGMTSEGLNNSGQYDEEPSQAVIKSLQLSYDRLSPIHKAAFLDAATVYYYWLWEAVERVVDAKVLKDLKDSSLLSHSEGFFALGDIYLAGSLDSWSDSGEERRRPARVLMHDLTRKFGRSLVESLGHDGKT